MAIIRTLKTFLGQKMYPKTVTKAIYDENNNRLDLMIQNGLSNPNILINSNFEHTVNQREKSIYSNNGYTVDRWEISNGSVSVENKFLRVNNKVGTTRSAFYQKVEFPSDYSGKTITISLKYRTPYVGLTLFSKYGDKYLSLTELISDGKWHTFSATITLPATLSDDLFIPIIIFDNIKFNNVGWGNTEYASDSVTLSKYADFKWAKVEHGNIATPYVPKRYDEELRDCRRFFRYGSTDNQSPIDYPMRTETPIVKQVGEKYSYDAEI